MKGKGAASPDNIALSFLKSVGSFGPPEITTIFNSFFFTCSLPRIWRIATIIPLQKAGKSPSEVASFPPISLTPCAVKLLEHILADRLYYIAQTNNLFSQFQTSSHKLRSCEDQTTQIVQVIEDGFDQRPVQHSALTAFNFS